MAQPFDEVMTVVRITEQIRPLLAGQSPGVQGAVLADLLAMWLAGHPPQMRAAVFEEHVAAMAQLIDVNEKMIFGAAGHPAAREKFNGD